MFAIIVHMHLKFIHCNTHNKALLKLESANPHRWVSGPGLGANALSWMRVRGHSTPLIIGFYQKSNPSDLMF